MEDLHQNKVGRRRVDEEVLGIGKPGDSVPGRLHIVSGLGRILGLEAQQLDSFSLRV
jgi:hypothetical protein